MDEDGEFFLLKTPSPPTGGRQHDLLSCLEAPQSPQLRAEPPVQFAACLLSQGGTEPSLGQLNVWR